MKREYPSTPEEAFEASLEGAYYADQLGGRRVARARWRVSLPSPAFRSIRAWDIGIGDYTSIWFFQRIEDRVRLVHYLQDCGEGLPHYVYELSRLRACTAGRLARFIGRMMAACENGAAGFAHRAVQDSDA